MWDSIMSNVHRLRKNWLPSLLAVSGIWLLIHLPSQAQEIGRHQEGPLADEKYQVPSKEIADVVLAAWHKNIALNNLNPNGRKILITKNDGLATVERQGRPWI